MSKPTATDHSRQAAPNARTRGWSLWTATSVNVAALITGLLLSMSTGELGWTFVICFGVSALVTTSFVRLGGLFLTVASLPMLYGIFTPVTALLIARAGLSDGADPWSKTMILSAIYPLAQFFPELAAITIVTIVIAMLRWRSANKRYQQDLRILERERKRAAQHERRNSQTATKVRQISHRPRGAQPDTERVPFSELIEDVTERTAQLPVVDDSPEPSPRMQPYAPEPTVNRDARRMGVEKPAPVQREKPARRYLSDDLYS